MENTEQIIPEAKISYLKSALEPALITSAIIVIYTMLLYVAGLHTIQELGYFGTLIILIAQIQFGIKFRKTVLNNNISFGNAFKYGFSIVFILAFVTSVFNFVYFEFIAPEVIDMAAEKSYQDMVERGLSEDQATLQMEYVMPWMKGWVFALSGILMTMFFGMITALIAAAFVKKESNSI
jgi:hypothetical protein